MHLLVSCVEVIRCRFRIIWWVSFTMAESSRWHEFQNDWIE